MRILYTRSDLFGPGDDSREARQYQGRSPGVDERQFVSVQCVSEHHRRHYGRIDAGGAVRLFDYFRANSIAEAVREASTEGTSYLAGGTNLVDLMKEDVERPSKIVDLNWLALKKIQRMQDGGLLIGALVTNADTAYHPEVTK